jgi:predicted nucleic acid-binding protein
LTVYADSSFFVSSCIHDVHTREVTMRMASGSQVLLTPFGRAEVANAIHRYVFRGAISAADARSVWLQFEQDRKRGIWAEVALPDGVWEGSIVLAQRFGPMLGVRTLDSLHVASALELNADKFWTFDERQEKLAEAVGLDTSP